MKRVCPINKVFSPNGKILYLDSPYFLNIYPKLMDVLLKTRDVSQTIFLITESVWTEKPNGSLWVLKQGILVDKVVLFHT